MDRQDVPSTQNDTPTVVTVVRRWSMRRRLIVAAAAIIVMTLAFGGGFVYMRSMQSKRLADDKYLYENSLSQAITLRGQDKNTQAVEVLNNYIDNSIVNQRKAIAIVNLANVYEGQSQNAKALQEYRRAEKLLDHGEYAVAMGIARTSYALGDKKTALSYYKQCLVLVKAKQAQYGTDEVKMLESVIQRVGAEQ